MWVYKHDLFHRDRPEDLALLRRRTCPTIDGRRQSLPRPVLTKATSSNHSTRSSNETSNGTKSRASISAYDKKRQMASPPFPKKSFQPLAKRPSLGGRTGSPMTVDTYFPNPVSLTESEDSDDQGIAFTSSERRSKAEDQAMIVLKIASQLAEHVRDPKNGSRISGLVTPTYGASRNGSISSGSLLTYDDEGEKMNLNYDHSPEDSYTPTGTNVSNELNSHTKPRSTNFENHTPLSKLASKEAIERLVEALDVDTRLEIFTAAKVSQFCMMTFPMCSDNEDGCIPIRSLLTSCQQLAAEFNLYRLALSPLTVPTTQYELFQHMWVHEESCLETTRSFSVFAVNRMQSLLRAIHDDAISCKVENSNEIARLERTILIWQKYGNETM